jgi:hypothetical protein
MAFGSTFALGVGFEDTARYDGYGISDFRARQTGSKLVMADSTVPPSLVNENAPGASTFG